MLSHHWSLVQCQLRESRFHDRTLGSDKKESMRRAAAIWQVHHRVVLAGPEPYRLQELINKDSARNLPNPARNRQNPKRNDSPCRILVNPCSSLVNPCRILVDSCKWLQGSLWEIFVWVHANGTHHFIQNLQDGTHHFIQNLPGFQHVVYLWIQAFL